MATAMDRTDRCSLSPTGWVDVDRSSQFTVAVANDLDFVLNLIAKSQADLGAEEIAELEEAIVTHHRRRGRPPAGRR